MNQVKKKEKCQCPPVPQVCPVYTHVYQQTSHRMYQGPTNVPSESMSSTPEPRATTSHYYGEVVDCRHQFRIAQLPGTAGDLTACQLRNPSSSLPQGMAGVSTHSNPKAIEDNLQKRELRLMKNREAARECRRKKKEYVRCLENRVAVLENQNKTLIEELRALKDIYGHKDGSHKAREGAGDLNAEAQLLLLLSP
ncbi:cAMP-responsive element modulator [Collichthys lucidus]|uniref:cAMP-responsive element modulator n=1 Tax=Collichthys lucidus TaxID=240159 RepID=A0A4U5VJL0_COLLU|nr:cAMP-responsive element modulator [Collichthys lucidus]